VADFGGHQAPELDLANCSNLTIQNALFSNTTYGVNADSCSNLTIANNTFSQTGAGILANNCQNTTVTSCHFSDMTAGYQLDGGLVGDWAQFANCTGVNLTNNTATNGPGSNPEDGFNFYNTTGVPGFDQITGNTAGGSNAVGSQSGAILQLEQNTSGFTVANNTFGDSPHDVICLTGANNITIENNHLGVAGDGNPSIQLQGGAGTPVTAGNVDLTGGLQIPNAADAPPTPADATPADATPVATSTQPADAGAANAPPTPADATPADATSTATNTQPADAGSAQHDGVIQAADATATPADATPADATPMATDIQPANACAAQHDGVTNSWAAFIAEANTINNTLQAVANGTSTANLSQLITQIENHNNCGASFDGAQGGILGARFDNELLSETLKTDSAAAVQGHTGIPNGDTGAALAADHAQILAAGMGFVADANDVSGKAGATSVAGLAQGTVSAGAGAGADGAGAGSAGHDTGGQGHDAGASQIAQWQGHLDNFWHHA